MLSSQIQIFSYEQLRLLLMLLLILMVLKRFQLMVQVHFPPKAIQIMVMVLNVYLKILMIVLLYAFEFFDNFILAEELFAKALRSFQTSVIITIYAKNYSHHQNHLQQFIIMFRSRFQFIKLRIRHFYIESFHIDITLNQNKIAQIAKIIQNSFTILVQNRKWFLLLLQ